MDPLFVFRFMLGFVIRLVVIALIGYVIWRVMRPRYDLRIVIDEYGIKYHEGLPKSHERQVLKFLENDLSFIGKVTIFARRQPDGYLKFGFKGQIDPGTRQQIRNFLISVM